VVSPDLTGYQTWHSRGLPPGPIATPGLASLQAALSPNTTDGYLYFVAKGDGTNGHAFAQTYEQHLQNIEHYYGTPSPGAATSLEPQIGPTDELPTVSPL
jgi:cell division protein YceG involved in septum cleavage